MKRSCRRSRPFGNSIFDTQGYDYGSSKLEAGSSKEEKLEAGSSKLEGKKKIKATTKQLNF